MKLLVVLKVTELEEITAVCMHTSYLYTFSIYNTEVLKLQSSQSVSSNK